MAEKKVERAFPLPGQLWGDKTFSPQQGMSLRDWFAGQALAGIDIDRDLSDHIALKAYMVADAMLKVRETETSK